MNGPDITTTLALPASTRVQQRIPKKMLVQHAAISATDKRRIHEEIESVFWEAVLKPATIGVPADGGDNGDGRGYTEISIIRLVLREDAASFRLAKLTHRAIPYPAMVVISGAQTGISLAHIRRAQNEADKWVLDGDVVSLQHLPEQDETCWPVFTAAMALERQPRTTLDALYQGRMDIAGGAADGMLSACRQRASDNPAASGPAGMCPAGHVHQAVAGCSRQRKTDPAAGRAESGNQAVGGRPHGGRGTALMEICPAVFWYCLSVGGRTAPESGGYTSRKW